jgi:hypothetical protein
MINGKYQLATIEPKIDTLPNQAYANKDVLFDWTAFQIPKGTCAIKSINITVQGKDAVAANGSFDFGLFFAKSINGVAPPSLGDANSAITVIKAAAARRHIIAYQAIDSSEMEDAHDALIGYNILGSGNNNTSNIASNRHDAVLEGDPSFGGDANYSKTVEGFQTIWVAGITIGAANYGTACLIDGAVTDLATRTFDVSEDTDADDIFAVGDELIACAANGTSAQVIGTVTAVTADTVTTDGVGFDGALADDDEVCFRSPITLRLGLEY